MRMLFVCFVVVMFISGKSANPVEHIEGGEASGETEIVNSAEKNIKSGEKSEEKSIENPVENIANELLNSENNVHKEVIRSKKSNYPSDPYQSAPYPGPSYQSPSYAPAPCGCSSQYGLASVGYNAPQISYGPPSYGGYSAPSAAYGQPQYRPKHGKRKGYSRPQPAYQSPQPSYHAPQPSYQPPQPAYQSPQPSYQSPQPSYQSPQPSYQSPQPSYQSPQPAYQSPQPSYQSYPQQQPSYQQQQGHYRSSDQTNELVSSAYPGYAAPDHSLSYPSPAPNVPCGSNLLFGCQPHVSEVPCSAHSPSYGSPSYGPPSAPSYRAAEDGEVSASPNNEMRPDSPDNDASKAKTTTTKGNAVASILSAPTSHVVDKDDETKNDGNAAKDPNVSTTNQLSPEEAAKQKKYDDLMKMSELAKSLAKETKDEKEIPPQNQQHQQPPPITHNANGKAPFHVPPPTAMNVPMNPAASNQVLTQHFSQQQAHPNPW